MNSLTIFPKLDFVAMIWQAVLLADRVAVMTSRPGRLKAIVETRLRRHGDPDIAESPQFNELVKHIWKLVREEAIATERK